MHITSRQVSKRHPGGVLRRTLCSRQQQRQQRHQRLHHHVLTRFLIHPIQSNNPTKRIMAAVEVQVRSLVVACHVSIHCDDATAHATPPLLTFFFHPPAGY